MLVAASLLVALVGVDSTKPPARPDPVKFTGDVGYVATSGNTSVQTLNLGDKVLAHAGAVLLSQQFAVVHGSSKGETVASNWRATVRADAALVRTIGGYVSFTYERNVFAGLSSRVSSVTGLTAQIIKTDRDKLVIEGGVSLTAQRATSTKGKDFDFLGGRAATAYQHKLGPRATFSQNVELLPDFRDGADLRINSESALLAPITHQIALKLSYVIRYDGVPEPGYQATDRLFTSGVQIDL
jgi:putative salt-induced outer membrane protein